MTEYNGYTNIETWAVCLRASNEKPKYDCLKLFVSRNGKMTAETAETIIPKLMSKGCPEFRSINDFKKVDWQQVAELINNL